LELFLHAGVRRGWEPRSSTPMPRRANLFIRRPDLRSSVIGVSDGIPRIDRDNQSNKEDV
jgi:hypothetical protein